jgi:8-oxo-dGTP pyrophosphatase MutT (NUDIX family)/phosphohistidine phosphatase SixA
LAGEVAAAGAVLWRGTGQGGVEIAVVHRPRYDDWSLPKGKRHAGERVWAAAVREVLEETGFAATLDRHLGRIRYPIGSAAIKTVDYFAARAGSGRFAPSEEVDGLRWVPPQAAPSLLSYQGDRDTVVAFAALPAELATLLLVRHAAAGRRVEWSGADELRPLSEQGWRQEAAIRALLPLFGVDRVHSAPLTRCIQTVERFAAQRGVPVVPEPLLSETGHSANPEAALARLLEIVAADGTAAVSSQGGVIPDLLSRLTETSKLTLDNTRSKKGAVWVLSFTQAPNPALVHADYIPEP